jgi:hypothetical protein
MAKCAETKNEKRKTKHIHIKQQKGNYRKHDKIQQVGANTLSGYRWSKADGIHRNPTEYTKSKTKPTEYGEVREDGDCSIPEQRYKYGQK